MRFRPRILKAMALCSATLGVAALATARGRQDILIAGYDAILALVLWTAGEAGVLLVRVHARPARDRRAMSGEPSTVDEALWFPDAKPTNASAAYEGLAASELHHRRLVAADERNDRHRLPGSIY